MRAVDRWVRAAFFGHFPGFGFFRFDSDSQPSHLPLTLTVGLVGLRYAVGHSRIHYSHIFIFIEHPALNIRSNSMRKLIVSNFVTLDGYYEGKDKSINSLFDYYHEDYYGDENFDFYNTER